MKRSVLSTAVVLGVMALSGCNGVATPIAVLPTKAAFEGQEPTKVGMACVQKVLWLFRFGDSRIRTAKRRGGISDIATVDTVTTAFLFDVFPFNLYEKQCTEVAGYSG